MCVSRGGGLSGNHCSYPAGLSVLAYNQVYNPHVNRGEVSLARGDPPAQAGESSRALTKPHVEFASLLCLERRYTEP